MKMSCDENQKQPRELGMLLHLYQGMRLKRTGLFLLGLGILVWATLVYAPLNPVHGLEPERDTLFQVTPVPDVPLPFQMTFEELGYGEQTLKSPVGQKEYTFRLPENWVVERGGTLDLEFSYFFTELVQKEGVDLHNFGEFSISMDGSLLGTYALNAMALERVHWRIDLPPDLLNDQPGSRHVISIALDAWFLCDTAHSGKLVLHPESTLSLNYTLVPLVLDLADYPRPFSQSSFEPDQVRFVLPAEPSEAEMHTAAVVAAGLGDMAGAGMVISATTDLDWLRMVEDGQAGADHLFVIGQPDRNQLFTWLSDSEKVSLPIPVQRRELALSSRGPGAVMPGEVFTYTISVTNTTFTRARDLTLTDYLPRQTDLVSCRPGGCRVRVGDGRKQVYWSLSTLTSEENVTFSLKLQLADTAGLSLTVPMLENLVVLSDRAQAPINVSSLSTPVGDGSAEEFVSYVQSDYFFVQDGQPVFEDDGILLEIPSPWDPQKVILLITGASDQAVHKAGQSLSLDTGLWNMQGPAALVREVRPSPPVTRTWMTDFTLAGLGYGDRTTYGFHPRNLWLDYWFDVPRGWHYTNEAYLTLFFGHSEAIDASSSTLTVLLNGSPLATVPLNQDNAAGGSLQVDLPSTGINPGASNRLSIRPVMQIAGGAQCQSVAGDEAWLRVSQDSWLHLDQHIEERVSVLDLDDFPSPFSDRPDLSDVLFVLPSDPGPVELEALLQVAAIFGRTAGGAEINPRVSLGNPDAAMLRDYDIVAIGRPTRNLLIQEVNAALPQPFVPGTDEVENQWGEVLLRLPPDIPLGYIQEIPSPWNEERALLAVTGTGDQGITWSAYAISRRAWHLDGDLVLVRAGEKEIEIRSFDTRRLTSSGRAATLLTAVPNLTPVGTPTVTSTLDIEGDGGSIMPTLAPDASSDASAGRGGLPAWVKLFIGAAGIFAVAVIVVGVWQLRRRRER